MNLLPGSIRQLGYVVENVDAAIAAWSGLGIGPWAVIRNVPLASVYRGKPSTPRIDVAFGYRGDVQLELIQQTNDAASPYRAWIEKRQFGLHHTAWLSSSIGADVQRLRDAGLELICDINMPTGGRYVYFAPPVAGEQTIIELLEATPALQQMFAQGIAAAANWDGHSAPTVIDFAALAGHS